MLISIGNTVYFNDYTMKHINGRFRYGDLKDFHWYIDHDDTRAIKHLAVDFDLWQSESTVWGFNVLGHKREYGGSKLNDTELRLWMLMDFHNTFTNIETLTIVFYDHGQAKYKEKIRHKVDRGELEFVDHAELGPYHRPKGRARTPCMGPWYSMDIIFGAPKPSGPEEVYDQIEALKAEVASDVAEIRSKKPWIKVPEIKWKYALRNGKFNTY